MTLKREGSKLVLTVGDQSATVPEDLFPKADGQLYGGVSGLITPRRWYVAAHDALGSPYQLTCIDRASDKVLWKSQVWTVWYGTTLGLNDRSVPGLQSFDRRR